MAGVPDGRLHRHIRRWAPIPQQCSARPPAGGILGAIPPAPPWGPDNITAYALEDSKLWLRHLQNLVVQVLGASFVLYKYVAGGDTFIFLAAILMFAVGIVKYAERTLALKRSNLDSIRSSLQKEHVGPHHHFHPPDYGSMVDAVEGDEFYVRRAHSMFHICKRAIVDTWVVRVEEDSEDRSFREEKKDPVSQSFVVDIDIKKEENNYKGMWTLMEMELSLMYDLLYTKAGLIHTWSGYGIRVASSLTAAVSFLLFQFSRNKYGHGRFDVAVSYTLLAGAFLLETASLLRALGSTWTYAFLCNTRWAGLQYAVLCTGRWDRLRWLVKATKGRRDGDKRSVRRWSGKIGQYNMLHVCSRYDRAYDPLVGKLARMLGYQDWWIRYRYSGTVEFPEFLKHRLFMYTKAVTTGRALNMQGVTRRQWGNWAFQLNGEMELYEYFEEKRLLGVEFQEGIIIWHIATEVFIAESRGQDDEDAGDLVDAVRMLSNYLIFLLVNRPYMLPGLGHSMLYRQTRGNLAEMWNRSPHHQKGDVFRKLRDFFSLCDDPNSSGFLDVEKLANILFKEMPRPTLTVPRLSFSCTVAIRLHDRMQDRGRTAILVLLLDLWMDFLVYAANRCSRESHAKNLSNGGELTTILWLMTDYLHRQSNNDKEERRRG